MKQLINQKWYEVPLEQRKRPRYRYVGTETEEPHMRHLLTLQQTPMTLLSQNQWYRPWIVNCFKGCDLNKEFADEGAVRTYMDKVWPHECAGAITKTLNCVLLAKL